MRRALFLLAPVLAWAGLIFFLSSRPAKDFEGAPDFPEISHLAHGVEYLVLGALIHRALTSHRGVRTVMAGVVAVGLALGYGLTDEYHQSFVEGRMPEGLDLVADTLGAAIGVIAREWFLSRRASRHTGGT